ncbi:MAG TPA: acyltransferase family protein [Solirubrobacteraceae bacterium]|nr:acyltransferase family protein [Solirubrobacteraceae bacterium]
MSREPSGHPRRGELAHHAGLDGLRGIAVLAVVLYHGGVSWVPGGFLGVEVFFVLSGFLITSLLVAEWQRSSTIALGAFWMRRARRLLPALFCLVAVIGIYYLFAGAAQAVPDLKGDGISALTYVSNWHQIVAGANYFAASGPVSPLEHTWSLAIEEQFYLVWPLVVLGVLWLASRRSSAPTRGPLHLLLGLSLVGAIVSALDMALLFEGGKNVNRIYYGTDTRAFGLLIGASLAIGFALPRGVERDERAALRMARRRVVGPAALLAMAAAFAAMVVANGSTAWMYPYGMLGLDAAVVILIVAAVTRPGCVAARLLAVGPLRALGMVSYGVYLWHFPLFLWLSEGATGLGGVSLLVVRLAVTLAVSTASYVLIEQPIRQRRRPAWLIRALTPLAAGGSVAALLLASASSALPVGVPAAATLPQPPPQLAGSDAGCTVTLKDAKSYGMAPPPKSKETQFVYNALGYHQLTWNGSAQKTFHTCPPKRVLLVGDSLAFTLGVPWLEDEERYGIQLADAGVLGCAFTTEGELNVAGTWEAQSAGCPNALEQWAADKKAMHAQAVVVELGYRDQFDWKINGKIVHLGQPAYDKYIQSQINHLVDVLGAGGTKILFLSIPYTHPPDLPNGSAAPAASPDRHAQINSMLEAAARRHPKSVSVLDLDQTVSPGNHFEADVNGQLCRFDGVHFSAYCSELVEPRVLGEVRKMLR